MSSSYKALQCYHVCIMIVWQGSLSLDIMSPYTYSFSSIPLYICRRYFDFNSTYIFGLEYSFITPVSNAHIYIYIYIYICVWVYWFVYIIQDTAILCDETLPSLCRHMLHDVNIMLFIIYLYILKIYYSMKKLKYTNIRFKKYGDYTTKISTPAEVIRRCVCTFWHQVAKPASIVLKVSA